jgi:hypothetical protein
VRYRKAEPGAFNPFVACRVNLDKSLKQLTNIFRLYPSAAVRNIDD